MMMMMILAVKMIMMGLMIMDDNIGYRRIHDHDADRYIAVEVGCKDDDYGQ